MLHELHDIINTYHYNLYNVGKTMSFTIPQSSPFLQVECLPFPVMGGLSMFIIYCFTHISISMTIMKPLSFIIIINYHQSLSAMFNHN